MWPACFLRSNPSSHAAVTPRGAVTPTVDMLQLLLLRLLLLLLINSHSITKQQLEMGTGAAAEEGAGAALTYLCTVRLLKNSRAIKAQRQGK